MNRMEPFEIVIEFVKWLVVCGIIVSIFAAIAYSCRDDRLHREACLESHKGQSWITETSWGSTSNGCAIVKVVKWSGDCDGESETLFVTKCDSGASSVKWNEQQGKYSVPRNNVGE